MRTRRGSFWWSFTLTLMLLLPMMVLTLFLVRQREQQNALRQVAAARGGVAVQPGAQRTLRLLLVVQQEQPAFVLLRADGPAQTLQLCGLPGALLVQAPAGTTTLEECTMAAGPGRALQLLQGTLATPESAAPLHYLAATPALWAKQAGQTTARVDTAALLPAKTRERLGYGKDPVAEGDADAMHELILRCEQALPRDKAAVVRPAVWAAMARQNRGLPAMVVAGLRTDSARTLTDLQAQGYALWQQVLDYLAGCSALQVEYATPECAAAPGGLVLTEKGRTTVQTMLR